MWSTVHVLLFNSLALQTPMFAQTVKPFFIVISLFYFRAEQNVDGPNYNLSGKLTEYTNTYKVYQKFIVLMS